MEQERLRNVLTCFAGAHSAAKTEIPHPSKNSQNSSTRDHRNSRFRIKKGFLTMNQRTLGI